jgi:hypothetical protein
VKLFFPHVRTVVFINRWAPEYAGYELFLPYIEGYLEGFGKDRAVMPGRQIGCFSRG